MHSFKNWLFGESDTKAIDAYGRDLTETQRQEHVAEELDEIENVEYDQIHGFVKTNRKLVDQKFVPTANGTPFQKPGDTNDTYGVGSDGTITIVTIGELRKKAATLFHCYDNHYQRFLDAPKFWEELQKIKHEKTGKSYHDLFIDKIVRGTVPVESEKKLTEYGDVIETAFELAKRHRLCRKPRHTATTVVDKKERSPEPKSDNNSLWNWLLR